MTHAPDCPITLGQSKDCRCRPPSTANVVGLADDPYGVAAASDQSAIEAEIVAAIQRRFRTFGGGKVGDPGNPISHWTKDQPAQFAAGVDVAQVVRFVLTAYFALRATPPHTP